MLSYGMVPVGGKSLAMLGGTLWNTKDDVSQDKTGLQSAKLLGAHVAEVALKGCKNPGDPAGVPAAASGRIRQIKKQEWSRSRAAMAGAREQYEVVARLGKKRDHCLGLGWTMVARVGSLLPVRMAISDRAGRPGSLPGHYKNAGQGQPCRFSRALKFPFAATVFLLKIMRGCRGVTAAPHHKDIMPLTHTRDLFAKALNGRYALGAFNVNNMELVQAIVEACEEEKAPPCSANLPRRAPIRQADLPQEAHRGRREHFHHPHRGASGPRRHV
jgi:hypothetical protein